MGWLWDLLTRTPRYAGKNCWQWTETSKDPHVPIEGVLQAFRAMGPRAAPALIELLATDSVWADQVIHLLVGWGSPVLPHLAAASLRHSNQTVRERCGQALGQSGVAGAWALAAALGAPHEPQATVAQFLAASRGQDPPPRDTMIWAVCQLGSSAVPALVEALRGDKVESRALIDEVLHRLGAAAVMPVLIGMLQRKSKEVRAAAATAAELLAASEDEMWRLVQQGPAVVSVALLKKLKDRSWQPSEADRSAFAEVGRQAEQWEEPGNSMLFRCRQTLSAQQEGIRCLTISPDGKMLASSCNNRSNATVQLWSLPDGQPIQTLSGHTGGVSCLAISPDGKVLVAGGDDKTVRLWSLPDGQSLQTFSGHTDPVRCLAISPDGRMLASGAVDGPGRLWSLPDGGVLKKFYVRDECVVQVEFLGARLVNLSNIPVEFLTIRSDGKMLVAGGHDGRWGWIRLWSLPDGQVLHQPYGEEGLLTCLALSPDGKVLAAGSEDGSVQVVVLGQPRLEWQTLVRASAQGNLGKLPDLWPVVTLTGHTASIELLAISPDGKVLVSGARNRDVRLWSLPDGRPLRTLTLEHPVSNRAIFDVSNLVISPDGKVLAASATAYADGRMLGGIVRLWSLPDGRPLQILAGHTEPITCMAFSPDGQVLVSGGSDKTIRLWTRELVRLSGLPVGQLSAADWTWIEETLQSDQMDTNDRNGLKLILTLGSHGHCAD
jgi:WD40 repeat protein